MKTSVEVIIHPVCLRFSYHNNEIVYMFASNPEQQLDEMEKLMRDGLTFTEAHEQAMKNVGK